MKCFEQKSNILLIYVFMESFQLLHWKQMEEGRVESEMCLVTSKDIRVTWSMVRRVKMSSGESGTHFEYKAVNICWQIWSFVSEKQRQRNSSIYIYIYLFIYLFFIITFFDQSKLLTGIVNWDVDDWKSWFEEEMIWGILLWIY